MPSVKLTGVKSEVVKTGFEPYDGPEPRSRGMYRAVVKQFKYIEFGTGSTGFKLLVELLAADGDPKDHAKFDGYPVWTNIVIGDKAGMQERVSNLLASVGASSDPNIVFEDGDIKKGVTVKTIGGKKPIGAIVNVDLKPGNDLLDPPSRTEIDGVFKIGTGAVAKASSKVEVEPDEEDDESDLTEDAEVEEDDEAGEDELAERTEELEGMTLVELRKIAKDKDHGITTTGLKKPELIEAILDVEFEPMVEGDDEEAEDEEEDDEAEEEAEGDEEEEEEDEEEGDPAEERRQELLAMSRVDIKKALKAADPKVTVLKSHTDAQLVELVISAEESETPF